MSNWNESTVGDFFDLLNGYAFKSADFIENGIPVIKIKNIKAGHFSDHEFSFVSPAFLNLRASKLAIYNDLLISMSGNRHDGSPDTWVGKVALFQKNGNYFINQRVGALRPRNNDEVDVRFAAFLLSSLPYQELFISIATSSGGQANLSPKQILSAPFKHPDIETQRGIGRVLGSLDDKIELNRRMNETLEAMAQAIFKDWFVDFGPTRRKLAGISDPVAIMGGLTPDAARASELAALFPDVLGDDGLPVGWSMGKLADLALSAGSIVQPSSIRTDTPYIGLEHMPRRSIMLDDWGMASSVSSAKAEFKKGQILFGKLRPYFHKVGLAPVSGVASTDIIVMDAKNAFDRALITCVASSDAFVAFADLGSDGTKMPRTSWSKMGAYPVAIADPSVRASFGRIVDPTHEKIIASVSENRTLAETRDYLLPKLMSGEVRVRDAEKLVEGAPA